MNYKIMVLGALLMPLANYCERSSTEARLAELEEKYYQKVLELSDLGQMISEKEKLISSYYEESGYRLSLLIDKRVLEHESTNNGKALSPEQKDKIAEETKSAVNNFVPRMCNAFDDNADIEDLFSKELWQDPDGQMKECEFLKFFCLRMAFENSLVKLLVRRYARCLKEMAILFAEVKEVVEEKAAKECVSL